MAMGFGLSGLAHLEHLYYAANALLLVLCWIPPILSRRAKIGLTMAYVFGLCLIGVDGHDAFSTACVACRVPQFKNLVSIFDRETLPALQVQMAFTGLALSALLFVAVDVARRRCCRCEVPDDA
jgi:hypothetical protein